MKCPVCNGNGGFGHYDTERDYFGRMTRVAGSERGYACDMCHGTGIANDAKYNQSVLAEDERQRAFDNEMGDYHAQWERELRREEWERSNRNRTN